MDANFFAGCWNFCLPFVNNADLIVRDPVAEEICFVKKILYAIGVAVALMAGAPERPAAMEWKTVPPAEAGFTQDPGDRVDAGVEAGALDGLHAVVVARAGKLVSERYYVGVDQSWGTPLGTVTNTPERLHDLRSVSKSVVGLLYGIALERGLVPALDQPIVASFPEYEDLAADAERRRITVAHALTMTLGLEWSEDLPYSDPRNSEIAMERAADRYRYVLSRPIVEAPGTRWVYSGGATALVARLIELGSDKPLADFGVEHLFTPLGIDDFQWIKGADGQAAAASGLRLTLRDLAKIGQMVLDGGKADGRQIVPQDWLEASFTPHVPSEEGLHYGYQWWLGTGPTGKPWMAGFGNGGQRLFLLPHLGITIAIFAGRYNQADAWKLPVSVITEYVFPVFQGP